ncbi:SCO family protein [Falsochrobactrum ovis]|uniref:SCO family protein n=1 Tax=Falsochrobactrum ovis TaxID=1293442 RepID=UPI00315C6C54
MPTSSKCCSSRSILHATIPRRWPCIFSPSIPRIVGLTGSEEEIGTVAASYRAYWRKVPTGDGDYTMDHTASIYLMDADGEFTSTISYDEHADMRLAKLKKLLAGGVS